MTADDPASRGSEDPAARSRSVLRRCEAMGFALAGIARPGPIRHPTFFEGWLEDGKHGSMAYLAEHADLRADPRGMLEGCRSVVMVADQYATRGDRDERLPPTHGRIARYARGRDYHRVIKKRLHALCDELAAAHPRGRFRAFVDTAPVHERDLAVAAGLGWTGKHTLLIHPERGSWLLLGGVLTSLDLEPADGPVADHCGTCTRCIDACPTGAITPYSVDARRCISYLTIERRHAIPAEFEPAIGDWLFGCDVCQEVCPHNSPRRHATAGPNPAYASERDSFDLLDVLGWTEADRRSAFTRSAMKRATLGMMRRNAVIAAGNRLAELDGASPAAEALAAALEALRDDPREDAELRSIAARSLKRHPPGC
ncbi:MAG: tRNA epoxyqueuosine(34) reductase QueG [Planctomycetota bacterium]